MNSKFFDVNKDKQDSIINAALMVFAQKGYKDASTDTIVKEAGISKGLLFHYFGSKQGLYGFICDYSTKYMILELTHSVKTSEKDFFKIISQISEGQTRVLRNYPYMHQFLESVKYEKCPEALAVVGSGIDDLKLCYDNIYAQIGDKAFIDPQDSSKVIDMLRWINNGIQRESLNEGILSPEDMSDKFIEYAQILRRYFYKSDLNESISIARQEANERNETVMDEIKMEMTYEDRLMNNKRPPAEEKPEETDEDADSKKDAAEDEHETDEKPAAVNSVALDKTAEEDGLIKDEKNPEALTDEVKKDESSAASDNNEEFFDEEDAEEELHTGESAVPKADTGEILNGSVKVPVFTSSYSSGNLDEIIAAANDNLARNQM